MGRNASSDGSYFFEIRSSKSLQQLSKFAIACGAAAWLMTSAGSAAEAFSVAKTKEGIQRKAVITVPKSKLYSSASGNTGSDVGIMDVYFILEGSGSASGKRTPVSRGPDKDSPDGWLDNDSFAEWNTSQLIDFAPQGGRAIAQVFDNSRCAIDYARTGAGLSSCSPIGQEPGLQGQTPNFKILVPVFKSEANGGSVVYEGGFVRVTPGQVVEPVDPAQLPKAGAANKAGFELLHRAQILPFASGLLSFRV